MNKQFSTPQRQSKIGVLLIFLESLFKILKGLWVLGVYLLVKKPSLEVLSYGLIGLLGLGIITLFFSVLRYKNFKFYIDYINEEFILQKGVFTTEQLNIPFDKIQQVYLKRSLLQRFIDVYEVVIDTAGSSDKEVNIKALSATEANSLKDILIGLSLESSFTDSSIVQANNQKVKWRHTLTPNTLLKLGVTSNYLRGVGLIFAFLATVITELNRFTTTNNSFYHEVITYVETNFTSVNAIVLILFIAFIFTIILGFIISTVEVFIKYFNLTLVQTETSMEVEMGLKTNTKTILKPRRVQMLIFSVTPIHKYFNLHKVRVVLAGSSDQFKQQKNNLTIPGLPIDKLAKIKAFLYKKDTETTDVRIKPHRILIFRNILMASIPLLIFVVFVYLFLGWSWPFIIPFILLYGIVMYFFVKKYYQGLELKITESFIIKQQGVWQQKLKIIEAYKLQSISIKQAIWLKKRGLYRVTFHTAGGDLSFPLVPQKALTSINKILYKIETSHKVWM